MGPKLPLAVGLACALLCRSAIAQAPAAQIKKTSTPPVIDGNGNDPVWANANVYGTTTFFQAEPPGGGTPIEPSPNLTLEWRALWDDTNLYVLAKANDDVIVNGLEAFGGYEDPVPNMPSLSGTWQDDSWEFYIDAQDVNNLEYNPGSTGGPTEPTYQFTAVAGWTPAIADDPNNPASGRINRTPNMLPNTSFILGINSYDGNDDTTRYPQAMGQATSGPVTANPAGGFDWTLEASFPWEALEETPADILARDGIFGFGVAYNDDDDMGGRDVQYMWGTSRNDLWHVSEAFPDVQLIDAPPDLPGDYNDSGAVDAADYVQWRDNPGAFGGDPAGYNTWRANFGRTAGAGSAHGGGTQSATPEPATIVLLLLLITPWVLRRLRG